MTLARQLTSAQLLIARAMTEDALLTNVLDAAQQLGWLRAHFRPAKTAKGWRTAVQGDGKGFPDLILLRGPRGLAVELKAERAPKKMPDEQVAWLDAFVAAGFESRRWRPAHWQSGQIEEVLA